MQNIEFGGTQYQRVVIKSVLLNKSLKQTLDSIKSKIKDDGACIQNAYFTAKATSASLIEGFVICKQVPDVIFVIRHCWNKIGGDHYDVTNDYIWSKLKQKTAHYYYPIVEHKCLDYETNQQDVFKIRFLSNAVEIAKGIQEEIYTALDYKRGQT